MMAFWRVGTRRRRVCEEDAGISWRWVTCDGGIWGGGNGGWKKGHGSAVGEEGVGGRDRYLLLVMEADLTGRHAGVLVEVRPGRVNDRYVVLLVAFIPISTLSLSLPTYKGPRATPAPDFTALGRSGHGVRKMWIVGMRERGRTDLQSSSPSSVERSHPPAPRAGCPIPSPPAAAGRRVRWRGCRRGTSFPLIHQSFLCLLPIPSCACS